MEIVSLIDFHCHLDLYPNHQVAVNERERAKTYTLAVTTTPKAWPQNKSFSIGKRYVRPALGLHPQLVANYAAEIALWKKYLPEARYIGEVGLDGSPEYKKSLDSQKEVFAEILQSCATAGDKILSVHSVRATKDVIDLVESNFPSSCGRIVLHWFNGSKKQVARAVALNCYFSFNTDMLRTIRGRNVAMAVPLQRILTETDAPFTKYPDIEQAIGLLGEIHDLSKEKIRRIVSENLKMLLKI